MNSNDSQNIMHQFNNFDENEANGELQSEILQCNTSHAEASLLVSASLTETGSEINIKSQNDGDALPPDSDENDIDNPTIQNPQVELKGNQETCEEGKILNNLNIVRGRRPSKKFPSEYNVLKKDKSQSKSPKREHKTKYKSRDHSVKIKTKFTPSMIEFISEQLRDEIFSGWIGEREYVEKLRAYRDIIEIDKWEDRLSSRLKTVMHNVKGVMEGTKWINITVPSSVSSYYCLWVLLESAPRPGHYWMHITNIEADQEFGLKITVKILREVHPFDGESKTERERRTKGQMTPDEWKEWVLTLTSLNLRSLWMNILTVVTPSNVSSGIRLLIVLIVTLVVAMVTFLQHAWEFFLRFMREFGIFVHHATPFAQSVITFFEKLVGGFFILVAMVYRDFRQPTRPSPPLPPPNSFPPLMGSCPPNASSPTRPLTYVPPQAWVFNRDDSD